jgi:hypothetical protein
MSLSDRASSLRVFISYARADGSAFADELMAGLEAAGFDPFLDRQDIAAGEEWEKRLDGLISQADTIVYVITPGAVGSTHCEWEIDHAERLSKRLIPVVAIDPPEGKTPAKLSRLNYVFFTRGRPFGVALKELCDALRSDLPWIREHTRLAELAGRWNENGRPADRLLRGSDVSAAKEWLTAWKVPSPEPTQLHRDFIAESDAGEFSRLSEERKRLDERAALLAQNEAAQTAQAKLLRRLRIYQTGGVAMAAVALGWWGYQVYDQKRQVDVSTEQQVQTDEAEQAARAESIEEARESLQDSTQNAPPTPGAPEHSAPQPQTPAVDAAVRQRRLAAGWDIDVFYCLGDAEARNSDKANQIGRILTNAQEAQLAAPLAPGEALPIGRVRVRALTELINARPGYQVHDDIVRAERGSGRSDERAQMARLIDIVRQGGGPALGEGVSATPTPFYLSVFLCGG